MKIFNFFNEPPGTQFKVDQAWVAIDQNNTIQLQKIVNQMAEGRESSYQKFLEEITTHALRRDNLEAAKIVIPSVNRTINELIQTAVQQEAVQCLKWLGTEFCPSVIKFDYHAWRSVIASDNVNMLDTYLSICPDVKQYFIPSVEYAVLHSAVESLKWLKDHGAYFERCGESAINTAASAGYAEGLLYLFSNGYTPHELSPETIQNIEQLCKSNHELDRAWVACCVLGELDS